MILVTGGTGYLGRALVARARVAATYCTTEPRGPAEWRRLDLRVPGAAGALVRELRPEAVIHAAYVARGADLARVTIHAPEELAVACREAGLRLIHLSTDLVFGGRPGGGYREEDPPSPVSDYGWAKAEAEARVLALHPGALVVRTSLLHGGDEPGPQERAVESAEWTFFTDEFRSPLAVGDLADALLELLAAPVQGVLHVGGADRVSRAEFARLLARARGLDPNRLRTGPQPDGSRASDCSLDSSRARSLLRTRLRGVREVLAP